MLSEREKKKTETKRGQLQSFRTRFFRQTKHTNIYHCQHTRQLALSQTGSGTSPEHTRKEVVFRKQGHEFMTEHYLILTHTHTHHTNTYIIYAAACDFITNLT